MLYKEVREPNPSYLFHHIVHAMGHCYWIFRSQPLKKHAKIYQYRVSVRQKLLQTYLCGINFLVPLLLNGH